MLSINYFPRYIAIKYRSSDKFIGATYNAFKYKHSDAKDGNENVAQTNKKSDSNNDGENENDLNDTINNVINQKSAKTVKLAIDKRKNGKKFDKSMVEAVEKLTMAVGGDKEKILSSMIQNFSKINVEQESIDNAIANFMTESTKTFERYKEKTTVEPEAYPLTEKHLGRLSKNGQKQTENLGIRKRSHKESVVVNELLEKLKSEDTNGEPSVEGDRENQKSGFVLRELLKKKKDVEPFIMKESLKKEQVEEKHEEPSIMKELLEKQKVESKKKELLQKEILEGKREEPSILKELLEKQKVESKKKELVKKEKLEDKREEPSIMKELLEKRKVESKKKELMRKEKLEDKREEPSIMKELLKPTGKYQEPLTKEMPQKPLNKNFVNLKYMKPSIATEMLKQIIPERDEQKKPVSVKEKEPSIFRELLKERTTGRNLKKTETRKSYAARKVTPVYFMQSLNDAKSGKVSYPVMFDNVQTSSPSTLKLSTWDICEETSLNIQFKKYPRNAFQEMIDWTEKGLLWKFPIDNEQGMDEEHNIHFSEHVFLERHLEGWCPTRGPIKHFMELVCVGLSKNPYLTVQEKYDHIMWYKDYFEKKNDVLKQLGLKEVVQSNIEKQEDI